MSRNQTSAFLVVMGALLSIGAYGCVRDEGRADPLSLLYRPPHGSFFQISSFDTTGGNRDRLELAPGDSAVLLDVEGPGVINRIWITVSSDDPHYLRRVALRMYWDDEVNPSVNVPLGDFFGNGFGKNHYVSLPMGVSSGGFYSYWPMPFGERARVVIDNGTGRELDAFYFQIGVVIVERLAPSMPYFHATWNRDIRTDSRQPHVVLAAHGTGKFVGLSLNAESYTDDFAFLEGDETFWVDGEVRGQGTGTEDYFNSGWYFDAGAFHAPFHGLVLKDHENGRIAAYRWHLPDPISFQDSIAVLLEHGHDNEEVADYATVAYWYQSEPHAPLESLPSADRRRSLGVKIPPEAMLASDMRLSSDGAGALLTLRVERPDRYEVIVYPLGGPGSGDVTYSLLGRPARSLSLESTEPYTVLDPVSLGTVVADSEVNVQLEPAEAPAAVLTQPAARWAHYWNVVGPFPNPRVLGTELSSAMDSVYGPEANPSLDAWYGTDGARLEWKLAMASRDGQVRLNSHFSPNEWVTAYAQAFMYSPTDRDVTLLLGADDAHVLWVNGERISERQGRHISKADDIAVPVRARAGWNRVLMKVMDLNGGWAFQVRVADPTDELRWSDRPQ